MLALGASLVLRAAAYSLTEAGEPYNVIAPPKMLANATTHSRVDCGAFLEEAECRKKQALQRKANEGVDLVQTLQDAFKKEVGTDTGKGELKAMRKAKRRRLKKKKKMLAAKKRKARKVKAMIKKVKAQRASSDNATQAAADAPKVAGAIYNETHPQQQQEQAAAAAAAAESKMTVAQKAKKEKEKTQTAQKEARQEAREQRKRLHTPGQDWNSTTSTSCWSMDSQASGEWCNSNCQAGGESSECASWCCCEVACNGWTEKSMPPSMKGAQNMTLPEPEYQGVPWGEKKARRAQKRLSQRRKKKAGKEGEAAGKGEEKNQEETKPNRKGKRKDRNAAKRVHFD